MRAFRLPLRQASVPRPRGRRAPAMPRRWEREGGRTACPRQPSRTRPRVDCCRCREAEPLTVPRASVLLLKPEQPPRATPSALRASRPSRSSRRSARSRSTPVTKRLVRDVRALGAPLVSRHPRPSGSGERESPAHAGPARAAPAAQRSAGTRARVSRKPAASPGPSSPAPGRRGRSRPGPPRPRSEPVLDGASSPPGPRPQALQYRRASSSVRAPSLQALSRARQSSCRAARITSPALRASPGDAAPPVRPSPLELSKSK